MEWEESMEVPVHAMTLEPGLWWAIRELASTAWPWPSWILGLAALLSLWSRKANEAGPWLLASAWHAGMAVTVHGFALIISMASCGGVDWEVIEWLGLGQFVPLAGLTGVALPMLPRRPQTLPAAVSVMMGFCSAGICMFGVRVLLGTPVATLAAWLR